MIYFFAADGFEETEVVGTLDVLRRAEIKTKIVGIGGTELIGSHQMKLKADLSEQDMELDSSLDAVILPGGMPGTTNLDASDTVRDALKYAQKHNLFLCAICAAPTVLAHNGLLNGKHATCFPGCETDLGGAIYTGDQVTIDGRIITANGPASALLFGEAIASQFIGNEAAHKILLNMQYKF